MRINVRRSVLLLVLGVLIMPSCVSLLKNDSATKKTEKNSEYALRQGVADYSKNYIGIKYKYAGKKPETGFDCSGFTAYVMDNFGIAVSSSSREQAKQGERINAKEAQRGDIIIFGKNGKINHVGLVDSNDPDGLCVVHSTRRGVVLDNISESKYWRPRVMYAVDVISE